MRAGTVFSISLALVIVIVTGTACGAGSSDRHEYALEGQILFFAADRKEATIKHEDIKGFMPAMTMPYKVRDAKEFEGVAPGDLFTATLVVVSNDAYLKGVKKVGQAPLGKAPADTPSASSGFELLKNGAPVPNARFVDQDGTKRDFASFKGSTVLVTFIYTRCPLPTFCPLMDRHFVTIQQRLKANPVLDVHLVSVSFDPLTDTPPVLKKHAEALGADPKLWTFLTGGRDEIDQFAARFGVSVARAMNDQRDIEHNLRTAIVDRDGNFVEVYTGNQWTPDQVLADIRVLVGGN